MVRSDSDRINLNGMPAGFHRRMPFVVYVFTVSLAEGIYRAKQRLMAVRMRAASGVSVFRMEMMHCT